MCRNGHCSFVYRSRKDIGERMNKLYNIHSMKYNSVMTRNRIHLQTGEFSQANVAGKTITHNSLHTI